MEVRNGEQFSTWKSRVLSTLLYIREFQATFLQTCGKVGMWEENSRKLFRREHSLIIISVPKTLPHPTQRLWAGVGYFAGFLGQGRVQLGYPKQKYQKLTLLNYCGA